MRSYLLKKLIEKIPSHIKITNRVSYELVYIPDFRDGKTLGETRFDTKQIVIKAGQTPIETAKVIIHEVFHALALENEFDLSEKQVLALEEATYSFLRLNKILDLISKLC